MVNGAIRKLMINGLERVTSGDNDPILEVGGRRVTEKQDTNNGTPVFIVDSVTGVITGIEERVSHKDGTFKTLTDAMAICGNGDPVSCTVTVADGTIYTAKGGVMIIPDSPTDGLMSQREGKVSYSIHPYGGEWV